MNSQARVLLFFCMLSGHLKIVCVTKFHMPCVQD